MLQTWSGKEKSAKSCRFAFLPVYHWKKHMENWIDLVVPARLATMSLGHGISPNGLKSILFAEIKSFQDSQNGERVGGMQTFFCDVVISKISWDHWPSDEERPFTPPSHIGHSKNNYERVLVWFKFGFLFQIFVCTQSSTSTSSSPVGLMGIPIRWGSNLSWIFQTHRGNTPSLQCEISSKFVWSHIGTELFIPTSTAAD